ncbi:MAG: mechanosensitive ion channel family protein [Saprospiraceae bacterium]
MTFEEIYTLIFDKLMTWMREFIRLLPNIFLAALILAIGLFLARYVKKIALKLIRKISAVETINQLFSSFIYIAFIVIIFFVALSILKLDKAVTSILAGAGILGLALAFAFQDIAANFISGIFISFRRPLQVGDLVEVDSYYGRVEVINLRDTTIMTMQGQRVIIPNKDVFQKPIKNYTSSLQRRLDLTIGISYGENLEQVKELTLEAARQVSTRNTSRDIELFYTEFGDSSINFTLRIWLKDTEEITFLQARSEAITLIKKAYDANHITIPFPIRTLDFGIKGGKKLSEMVLNITNTELDGTND